MNSQLLCHDNVMSMYIIIIAGPPILSV